MAEDGAGATDGADPLTDALGRLTFAVTALLNRLGAEHDLSLTQLRVLGILRDRERVGVTTLADHVGLEKSTMTGLVDRGVRRGLLERTAHPTDGRAVDVGLTPAGRDLADRLQAAFAVRAAPLTQPLGPADRRRLTTLLDRVLVASSSGLPPSH